MINKYGFKNIYLRKIRIDDTQKIVNWRNNDFVIKNHIDRTILTNEKHLHWYNSMIKTGKVQQFIIVDKACEKEIGTTFLKNIDYKAKEAELGIFIGEKEYLGKGYGKLVVSKMLDFAYDEFKLNHIYARLLSTNLPSYYMFINLGFNVKEKKEEMIEGEKINVYFVEKYKNEVSQ